MAPTVSSLFQVDEECGNKYGTHSAMVANEWTIRIEDGANAKAKLVPAANGGYVRAKPFGKKLASLPSSIGENVATFQKP